MAGRGERGDGKRSLPAWRRPSRGERRWPAALAIVFMIVLQLALPDRLSLWPSWLLPAIESGLLITLAIADPGRVNRESAVLRALGLALVAVASFATVWSVQLLVVEIATAPADESPARLLVNGGTIWLTNVIVFALWYWELDRGGPAARANARDEDVDFLFASMTAPRYVADDWRPTFVDYLYVSFTNAAAFSPTDTMPMTRWAKLTMMFQASISIVVVLLVIAKAVNILGPDR